MLWAVQAHRAAGHPSRLSLITFGLQRPPGSAGRRPAAPARYAALSLARSAETAIPHRGYNVQPLGARFFDKYRDASWQASTRPPLAFPYLDRVTTCSSYPALALTWQSCSRQPICQVRLVVLSTKFHSDTRVTVSNYSRAHYVWAFQ